MRLLSLAPAAVLGFASIASVASIANAAQLYSNGPVITNPTGGTGGIAGLPISVADSFVNPSSSTGALTSNAGIAASFLTASPAMVAEDFTVPAGGWNLDTLTVYAFQTGQTTATITKVHVNLWTSKPYSLQSPDLPAGAPVPTPVLAADLVLDAGPGTFVGHRQGHTSTSTSRPFFSYTVSLDGLPNGGILEEGTYWISWSYEGATSPSAGVFTPLISPRTAVTDHNARQFSIYQSGAPLAWFEGREGFLQGVSEGRPYALPFELGGTVVPEPSGALGVGGIALALLARRRR